MKQKQQRRQQLPPFQRGLNYIIVCLSLLFVFACTGKNRHVIKKEHYTNGNIKSTITYANSKRNGEAIFYYENGKIRRFQYYKNGLDDSIFKEYYPNGILKKQGMYTFGTLMGSMYFYYPNGNLDAYNAKDYLSQTFYSILFDSLGHKTYEKGLNIANVVGDFNIKKIHSIKDRIHMVWAIAEPPGYKNEIQISIGKKSDKDTNVYITLEPFKNYTVVRSIIDYKTIFKQPGDYQIIIGSKLVQTGTNYVTTDTSIVHILVK